MPSKCVDKVEHDSLITIMLHFIISTTKIAASECRKHFKPYARLAFAEPIK